MRSQDRIDDDSIENVPGRRQRKEDRHGHEPQSYESAGPWPGLAYVAMSSFRRSVVSSFGGLVVWSLNLVGDEMKPEREWASGSSKGKQRIGAETTMRAVCSFLPHPLLPLLYVLRQLPSFPIRKARIDSATKQYCIRKRDCLYNPTFTPPLEAVSWLCGAFAVTSTVCPFTGRHLSRQARESDKGADELEIVPASVRNAPSCSSVLKETSSGVASNVAVSFPDDKRATARTASQMPPKVPTRCPEPGSVWLLLPSVVIALLAPSS